MIYHKQVGNEEHLLTNSRVSENQYNYGCFFLCIVDLIYLEIDLVVDLFTIICGQFSGVFLSLE